MFDTDFDTEGENEAGRLLKKELGIPENESVYYCTVSGLFFGTNWQRYTVEMSGIQLETGVPELSARPETPVVEKKTQGHRNATLGIFVNFRSLGYSFPHLLSGDLQPPAMNGDFSSWAADAKQLSRYPIDYAQQDVVILLLRQRVTHENTRLVGDVRWQPSNMSVADLFYAEPGTIQGERVESILHIEDTDRLEEIKTIWAGLQLLRRRIPSGRPIGSGMFRDAEEFQTYIAEVIRVLAQERKTITEQSIADYLVKKPPKKGEADLKTDTRQIRRWLNEYGLTWEELIRDEKTNPHTEKSD